jgi:FkbM family methyltransferase
MIRHDPRDKELPFEPDGFSNRILMTAAHALERRGWLWRANFTVTGRLANRPLRVPLQFGSGWEHLRMREVWLFRAIERVLRQYPGVFVDVGVNVGHTLIKVKAADPDRDYIGFEPNPNCLRYAQHLIDVNKFTKSTIVPVGLSDRSGLFKLFHNPDVDPSATIVEGFREPERYAHAMVVPVAIGDEVLDDLGVGDVSIVKIDVEGGELDVLRGLRRTIARCAPFVFCEVLPVFDEATDMGRFRVRRQAEMLQLIAELRYSMFRIYVNEAVEEVTDFGGVHSDMTLANYIFVPNGQLEWFRREFRPTTVSGAAPRLGSGQTLRASA